MVLEFRVLRKKNFYFSRAHYVKLITRVIQISYLFIHLHVSLVKPLITFGCYVV